MDFLIPGDKIKEIYYTQGNNGCFISKRIVVDGMKIGYMYREIPDTEFPDSGWRFFSGDESDDYVNVPENIFIVSLNTACNYDSTIIDYLDAAYGSAFIRVGDRFVLDD